MLLDFIDIFLPAIIAAGEIQSELALFVVAVVFVMQIFYMSELGALILGSDIPVNFGELFVIFIERTIISLVLLAFNKI
ncbi:MAG: hypothetical protein GX046_06870 [Tissierellia bacterium]|jgi:nucleoside recognition membrane protein YjiH|nr:hypothetical protein [Tissierellia bacterium]